jgi:hypothetical protein
MADDSVGTTCTKCGQGREMSGARHVRTAARVGFTMVAWTGLIVVGACAAILVPINLVLIPCWLAAASSVGPLARELFDGRCEECDGVPAKAGTESTSARRAPDFARSAPRPAHERAMKGSLIGKA